MYFSGILRIIAMYKCSLHRHCLLPSLHTHIYIYICSNQTTVYNFLNHKTQLTYSYPQIDVSIFESKKKFKYIADETLSKRGLMGSQTPSYYSCNKELSNSNTKVGESVRLGGLRLWQCIYHWICCVNAGGNQHVLALVLW